MTTFHIEQFGCRATQADAAAIERQLLDCGHAPAPRASSADVVVVNTCTVTAAADAQARDAIRSIHRARPEARILVTGCYAQRAPEELAALPGVSWVVGNSHQAEIPRVLSSLAPADSSGSSSAPFFPLAQLEAGAMSLASGPAKILSGDIFERSDVLVAPVLGGEADRTRPVLKIQDGCNNRCSYCVIPFVRGRSRSLPPEAVLGEIRRLAAAGRKEIVLSGINLGSYGRDLVPRVAFGDLLRRILHETPLPLLRVSSIEPMDVTEDLIALCAGTRRVARHFHVPLQSGADRILAAMHRWYRAEHYAARIERIRERLPGAAIGADVIAGFPGESEADHAATLEFLRRLPLTYLHVFSFSKRPGTAAANLAGEVAPSVIRRRASELRALGEEKSAAFRARHAGRTLRVLTLRRRDHASSREWTPAISGNYLNVRVAGEWPSNEFLDVVVESVRGPYLTGLVGASPKVARQPPCEVQSAC